MSSWVWKIRIVFYAGQSGEGVDRKAESVRIAAKLREKGVRATSDYVRVVVERLLAPQYAGDALSALCAAAGTVYEKWPEGEVLPWTISSSYVKQSYVKQVET